MCCRADAVVAAVADAVLILNRLERSVGVWAVVGLVGLAVAVDVVASRRASDVELKGRSGLGAGPLAIELVARRPVPRKLEAIVQATGFVFFLGLILVIAGQEIWPLIAK